MLYLEHGPIMLVTAKHMKPYHGGSRNLIQLRIP